MAHFQWVVGVQSEVTNAITPPSPPGGGKKPKRNMLVWIVSENQQRVAWWEEIISGIIGWGAERQAMELSYFPEVLVCETDSSVGGERFVFRATKSPKGS